MSDPLEESLFCTPARRLFAGDAAPSAVALAFEESEAAGFLRLALAGLKQDLPAPLAWAREWTRQFLTRLCRTGCAGALGSIGGPDADVLERTLAALPPMRGAEYVDGELLIRLWSEMEAEAVRMSNAAVGGLAGWLKEQGELWHLVGRVTLHLAENPRNTAQPFAFLATCADGMSADGRVQHTPLGRALQASQKDPAALHALLHPVREAAVHSPLVRELLETKRLFQALPWTPEEAYVFLRQVPALEKSGLVVKLPDWWRNRRPARPVVNVVLDGAQGGGVGLGAMLSFKASVTLGGEPLTPEELSKIQASPAGLVNLRGQWVEVAPEQLQQALEHWGRAQSAHQSGTLPFHVGMRWLAGFQSGARSGGDAPDLEAGREWMEIVAGKHLDRLLEELRTPKPVEGIPGLEAELRPYQREGVGWLRFLSGLGLGACLADDMGLGKTLQIIALFCLLRDGDGALAAPCLVVVPASLVGNWMRELRRFAPHLRVQAAHPAFTSAESLNALREDPAPVLRGCDVMVTTYGFLQRTGAFQQTAWDLVVLDEAQAIKNPATQQAQAVKMLSARARVALTGTPVENRLGDLWSLFDFLNPGLLGRASEFAGAAGRLNAGPEGYAPLRRLLAPYLLRRLKTDRRIIADLPAKTEVDELCLLSKKQALLYARLVAQLKADLANPELSPAVRSGLVLGYLLRFKQVCNHPSHWSGDGRFEAGDSGKFLRLGEIAGELAERQEKCLVFTQFSEMTEPIAAFLAQIFGRPGLVLHGGTPVHERAKLVEGFQRQDGPPFFVLSVKAGGTGLTLTEASHVIHFDRWWNPAVENQATDRAYRIGQTRNVLVHKFVCMGTIEERVDALLSKKSEMAESLLQGGEGAPSLLVDMSNDELLEFVRLDIRSAL